MRGIEGRVVGLLEMGSMRDLRSDGEGGTHNAEQEQREPRQIMPELLYLGIQKL